MKRYKLLALAMVVAMGLTACTPQEVEPVNAPEPSSSSEPIVSSEPKVTPSEAVPSDIPVSSDVEETADIEGESNLDESGEVITEVEGKTPGGMVDQNTDNSTGGSTSGNTGSSKPSGGNDNSSTQSKPTPPASNNGKDWSEADDEVGGSIDDLINAGKDQDGIDDGAWDEGFDPVNNGDFGGNISEEDILNWGSDNTDGGETGGGTFTDDELDNWGHDQAGGDADNLQQGFDPVNNGGTLTDDELDNWSSDNGLTDGQKQAFDDAMKGKFDPVQ